MLTKAPTILLLYFLIFQSTRPSLTAPLPLTADIPTTPTPSHGASLRAAQTSSSAPAAPMATPSAEPVFFSYVGAADIATGDGIVEIDFPLASAICSARAVYTSNSWNRTSYHFLRLETAMTHIDNTLFALGAQDAVASACTTHPITFAWPDCSFTNGCFTNRTYIINQPHLPRRYRRGVPQALTALKALKVAGKPVAKHILQKMAHKSAAAIEGEKYGIFTSVDTKLKANATPWSPFSFLNIASTAMSLFSMWSTTSRTDSNLAAHIEEAFTEIGANTLALHKSFRAIANISEEMFRDQVTTQVQEIATSLRIIGNSLRNGRIDVASISASQFASRISILKDLAEMENKVLRDTSLAGILNREVNYVVHKATATIRAYLKVPLYSSDLKFDIYKLQQTPILTPAGAILIDTTETYLALSTTSGGTFYTATENEFSKCEFDGGRLACPHSRVIHREGANVRGFHQPRCIHAVYRAKASDVKKFCRFIRAANTETVLPITQYDSIFYTPVPVRMDIICGPTNRDELSVEAGHSIVSLPAGCRAFTSFNEFWTATTVRCKDTITVSSWSAEAALAAVIHLQPSKLNQMLDTRVTPADVDDDGEINQALEPGAIASYILSILLTAVSSAFAWKHRRNGMRALNGIYAAVSHNNPPPQNNSQTSSSSAAASSSAPATSSSTSSSSSAADTISPPATRQGIRQRPPHPNVRLYPHAAIYDNTNPTPIHRPPPPLPQPNTPES